MQEEKPISNILIAEDHTLFRKAMISLIGGFGMRIQGVDNGAEGLELLSKEKFDLVITDLEMPILDGYKFCKEIKKLYPNQKIMVLTMHESIKFIKALIELGVDSYLIKNIEPDELELAIREVLQGRTYFPQVITAMIIQDLVVNPKKSKAMQSLTERELNILRLLIEEKTVAEIAEEFEISPRTVENHKSNMMEKLNAKTMIGLVKKAYEEKLI